MEKGTEKPKNFRYFLRKELLAILLLLMIFGYAGINLATNYKTYANSISEGYKEVLRGESTIAESIAAFENVLTEESVERMKFIELYSFEHVLLGKEEIKNFSYLKDKFGYLHYASFYRDYDDSMFEMSLRVKRLQDAVEEKGTKVIFVIPPAKGSNVNGEFSKGLPLNDPYRNVNELMFWLNRLGVSTLNYAEYMPNRELSFEKVFFKTDHHWTVDAAFYATKVLVDKMNESGGIPLNGEEYLARDCFTRVVYKDAMFGSMGRGAGANFAGVEDYVAYHPNREGHFRKESIRDDGRTEITEGGYYDTLLDLSVFDKGNLYRNQVYSFYMNAIRPYDHVVNLDNPDGIKVLLVRDSYFAPVMAFLAPMTGQIDSIWSLEDDETLSVENLLASVDYDYVIIEVYPYNIQENAFQYFKESQDAAQ